MQIRTKGQVGPRILIYLAGLLLLSLGIVLILKANLGATPWDVLHVGLYYVFGLTIGSWSIIVGLVILLISTWISRAIPQIGAFSNMVLIGLFIDLFFLLPFIQTPEGTIGKLIMFSFGLLMNGYGMGLYISAEFGAGPRDSLMIALAEVTHWKVRHVRAIMEIFVLIIGWMLGGPVFWGTILISLLIGPIAGICLPQCQRFTQTFLLKLKIKNGIQERTETG